jgi:ATP-dependent Clp protease adaptor protein ClpS
MRRAYSTRDLAFKPQAPSPKTRYDRNVGDPKVRDRIQSDSQVEERVDQPRLWKVLLHNDDYTTQEFVVWVLESIFHLPHAEAFAVMMHVHQAGVGVAGLFTRDVAETKVKATQQLAEQHEYPLLVTIEPDAGEPRE